MILTAGYVVCLSNCYDLYGDILLVLLSACVTNEEVIRKLHWTWRKLYCSLWNSGHAFLNDNLNECMYKLKTCQASTTFFHLSPSLKNILNKCFVYEIRKMLTDQVDTGICTLCICTMHRSIQVWHDTGQFNLKHLSVPGKGNIVKNIIFFFKT